MRSGLGLITLILLHRILDRDPDLFVIYVYRDPRSVMTSKHLSSKNYFANYVIWKRYETAARKLSGHVRMLEMRYEDLIMKPTLSQERIQESFGFLKRTQSFADFDRNLTVSADAARAMNGLRSLDSNCLHKWKTHLPRVKDQLLRFPTLQDDIEYRAYENDSSWQKIMDGVEAIPYSCRYGQSAPLKELEKCIRLWSRLNAICSAWKVSRHPTGVLQIRDAAIQINALGVTSFDPSNSSLAITDLICIPEQV